MWRLEGNLQDSVLSFYHVWVSEIELRLSGLEAHAYHWTILPALDAIPLKIVGK